jgi:hypothetical protein
VLYNSKHNQGLAQTTDTQTTVDGFSGLGADHNHKMPYSFYADQRCRRNELSKMVLIPVRHVPNVIIGTRHSGLAMSRRLTERSIRHVGVERGEVAKSWSTERWPSSITRNSRSVSRS